MLGDYAALTGRHIESLLALSGPHEHVPLRVHSSVVGLTETRNRHGALHVRKQLTFGTASVKDRSRPLSDFIRLRHVPKGFGMNLLVERRRG